MPGFSKRCKVAFYLVLPGDTVILHLGRGALERGVLEIAEAHTGWTPHIKLVSFSTAEVSHCS